MKKYIIAAAVFTACLALCAAVPPQAEAGKEISAISEVKPASEPEPEPVPAPTPTTVPAPSQTVIDPQSGDTVYVPGFGWLECQVPGKVIHDESIYENSNKISIMG